MTTMPPRDPGKPPLSSVMAVGEQGDVQVSAHPFVAIGRLRHSDKCRACFATEDEHPTRGWETARPYGDTSPARSPR